MLGFKIFPKFDALSRFRDDTYFDATWKGQEGPRPPIFMQQGSTNLASLVAGLVSEDFLDNAPSFILY